MAHSSPVRKDSSFRHLVYAVVSWLVMTLSVMCGVLGTIAAFYCAALLINSSRVLLVVALVSSFWLRSRLLQW